MAKKDDRDPFKTPSRSWFIVFNNPENHGYSGEPEEILNQLRDEWIGDSTTRTGMWAYCISAEGLRHVHMVLEDVSIRFSTVKKAFPTAHLEPTLGSKKEAEDYIYKRGKFAEKGEEILCVVKSGEIQGNQGQRSDLKILQALIDEGKKPEEIFEMDFAFRRYERMVREAFFQKRKKEVPPKRDVHVHLLVGQPGSGKSYTYVDLCEEYGEDEVYFMTDYAQNGGFDHYAAEKILFMDEYKAQFPYGVLLTVLDGYKAQLHARYGNVWSLWSDVYITTVFSPESLYEMTVPESRRTMDSYAQFRRRIEDITYCCKTADGEFKKYTIPMSKYKSWDSFKEEAIQTISKPLEQLAIQMPEGGELPF